MKKKLVLILFFTVQVALIFLYINKESRIIKLSYQKQRYQKLIDELINQKRQLNQLILSNQNHNNIKEYAAKELKLKNIKLNQIKLLKNNEQVS